MILKKHKILYAAIIILVMAAAITTVLYMTNKDREGDYKGTLVYSTEYEVAA